MVGEPNSGRWRPFGCNPNPSFQGGRLTYNPNPERIKKNALVVVRVMLGSRQDVSSYLNCCAALSPYHLFVHNNHHLRPVDSTRAWPSYLRSSLQEEERKDRGRAVPL